MMRLRITVGVLVAGMLLTACGGGTASSGSGGSGGDEAPTTTEVGAPDATTTTDGTDGGGVEDVTATTPGGPTGIVEITQEQTACCYIEGQISFLRLTGEAGVIFERAYAPGETTAVLETVALPAGEYELESWQQPCSASCPEVEDGEIVDGMGAVDAGFYDQCTFTVRIEPDERLDVLVSFAPAEGCDITVDESAPPAGAEAAPDLDCAGDARQSMIIDYAANAEGADTALQAVESFRDLPEGEPVEVSKGRRKAEYAIVDPDGHRVATVWTFRGEGGWLVGGTET